MSVKIKWLGHAAFLLSFKGKRLLIDPWIADNPMCPIKLSDLENVDFIAVTHDHYDHLGNAEEIARRFNSMVIGIPELIQRFEEKGLRGLALNMGSLVDVNGLFKVALVPATHTCSIGQPVGVVLNIDGLKIYHMGDTGYTAEFQSIRDAFGPDIVLIPIGGHYTMGPREAALALRVLKPRIAIPMHYATFPVLVKDAEEFAREARSLAPEVKVMALKPGEEIEA